MQFSGSSRKWLQLASLLSQQSQLELESCKVHDIDNYAKGG